MEILQISTELRGDLAVVHASGEVDMSSVGLLRNAALELLHGDSAPAKLEVDLAGVTFLDSSGIGALLDLLGKAERIGAALVLTNVAGGPHRAIRAAGLASVLLGEGGFVQPRQAWD